MSRRKRTKVVHGPVHHYAPLAMSPVVSFDKQATQQYPPAFHSPIARPATTSPVSDLTRTSSYSNVLLLRSVASDSPLSSPSVSLSSAPLLSPVAVSETGRRVDLQHDPYLLADDELPDVDALIAQAQPKQTLQHNQNALQQVEEVPATPTPPNLPPQTASPLQSAAPAPPVQRTLSYLLADSLPSLSTQQSPPHSSPPPTADVSSSIAPSEADDSASLFDDYPTLSQLLNEEEEERRQVVEEEDFASLDELLHQSDDEDTTTLRTSDRPTQQPTQPTQSTQPTQVLTPRRSTSSVDDETAASDVDELAATQVVQQRSWAEDSQSQSQRPPDHEQNGNGRVTAGVSVSVSCGVSEWQSPPTTNAESGISVLARPHLLHTGRILLSYPSSLSPSSG